MYILTILQRTSEKEEGTKPESIVPLSKSILCPRFGYFTQDPASPSKKE